MPKASGRLARCACTLLARGFAADTPVVAVRAASWPDESVERTSLAALAATGLAVDERPVVLLVGRAFALRTARAIARRAAGAAEAGGTTRAASLAASL
jgi:siroheme synthase